MLNKTKASKHTLISNLTFSAQGLLEAIQSYISSDTEILLLLHKNAPHFYGQYDLNWFANKGLLKIAIFGGGEDPIKTVLFVPPLKAQQVTNTRRQVMKKIKRSLVLVVGVLTCKSSHKSRE